MIMKICEKTWARNRYSKSLLVYEDGNDKNFKEMKFYILDEVS